MRNISMLNSLQILRGLAAWMVVFHHIVQSFFMGEKPNYFWEVFSQYGSFGVDIFFILSGFVMGLVSQNYKKKGRAFLINRAYRVLPVYWFYTILLVISIIIFPAGVYLTWWEDFSLLKSLALIPNANPNGYGSYPTLYVGWTLVYEMFFYFIFSLILMMNIPKPAIICSITLLSVALLFRNYNFLGHGSLLLIEFSLGIVVFLLYKEIKSQRKVKAAFVSIAIIFILILMALILKVESFVSKALIATTIVSIFVSLESIFSKNIYGLHFLKKLGDYSYSTYLGHIIVIGWFYWILGVLELRDSKLFAVTAIVSSVYFISRLSYQYVENNSYIAENKHFALNMLTNKKSS